VEAPAFMPAKKGSKKMRFSAGMNSMSNLGPEGRNVKAQYVSIGSELKSKEQFLTAGKPARSSRFSSEAPSKLDSPKLHNHVGLVFDGQTVEQVGTEAPSPHSVQSGRVQKGMTVNYFSGFDAALVIDYDIDDDRSREMLWRSRRRNGIDFMQYITAGDR
jgi:hypothetical protein